MTKKKLSRQRIWQINNRAKYNKQRSEWNKAHRDVINAQKRRAYARRKLELTRPKF